MKTLITNKSHFSCKDGKNRKITDCLIANKRRPKNNWVVSFSVNGVPHETQGGKWKWSMESMINTLEANNVKNAAKIAGATCNYAWLSEVPFSDQLIPPADLLSYCREIEIIDTPIKRLNPDSKQKEREKRLPSAWGAKHWEYLHTYLGQDDYKEEAFHMLLKVSLNALDPVKNPSRGCSECHSHFNKALFTLDISSQEKARQWLWEVHNDVNKREGKSIFAWNSAVKKYGWDN